MEAGGSVDSGGQHAELVLLEKSHALSFLLKSFSNLFTFPLLILVSFGLSGMKRRKRSLFG